MSRSVYFGHDPPWSDLERVVSVLGDAFGSIWVSGWAAFVERGNRRQYYRWW